MKPKKSELDYLLIPGGPIKWEKQREEKALENLSGKRKIKNVLFLRGKDSEEEILYLGKKLKGKERIGFVTFPLHYQEYKELIKKAQKDGNFPKNIKIENIPTEQSFKQFIYGIFGLLEERADKKVNYVREEHESRFMEILKQIVKKILG